MTRLAASLLDREGPGSSQKEPFCRYKPSDGLEPSAPLLAMWRVGVRIARTAAFGRILADALLRLDRPGDMWFAPIETISQSEDGFERTYQGSAILASCCMDLMPGVPIGLEARLEITEL